MSVYLVDASSPDGTADAVRKRFPSVTVIVRDANHYWGGGMREAIKAASAKKHDFLLWLNDDTRLYTHALQKLLDTAIRLRRRNMEAIVVGSTRDPDTGKLTYGGLRRAQRLFSFGFLQVMPADEPVPCDTMTGNIVLVPHVIAKAVGTISPAFTHNFGDIDFGLRARELGYSCWVAPGYLGECARNPKESTWHDPHLSLADRRAKLRHVKGLPPDEYLLFVRRHGGWRWLVALVKLYGRMYFPATWDILRRLSQGRWSKF